MNISSTYVTAIIPLIPFFSAIASGILVTFSLQDCLKREERRLKRIVLFYFSISGIGWFVTICYAFSPVLFTWLNIVCLLSFILPAIFFFRIIRFLTRLGQPENFSLLHYVLPGILVTVTLIWSLFIPFDVQLEIVRGRAEIVPAGYESFARFYIINNFEKVTISKLEKSCEKIRGTIFYYFSNKQELFEAVVDDFFSHFYHYPMRYQK